MFNDEVLKDYHKRKLNEIKRQCKDRAYELAEDFKEAETDEYKFCIAQDFITQINTIREIEKEIKEAENKEKEGNNDKHINAQQSK